MKKIATILFTVCLSFFLFLPVLAEGEEATPTPVMTAQPEKSEEVQIQAGSASVMDRGSGRLLYEKNSDERMDPASLSKLMSVYLACENLKMDDSLTMSDAAFQWYDHDAGVLWIQQGETLSVSDCVHAGLLVSANDTTAMLVEAVGGDLDSFVGMMNAKAKEIGMENTHFDNPFGLHSDGNYSTARDLCLLLQKALKNDSFAQAFQAKRYTINPTNMQEQSRVLVNDSGLFVNGSYAPLTGVKVGNTAEGGWDIASSLTSDGTSTIAVVLGAESQESADSDLQSITGWTFSSYQTVTITKDEIGEKTIAIYDGHKHVADVTFSSDTDFSALLPADVDPSSLSAEIVPDEENPESAEEATAHIIFLLDGKKVSSSEALRTVKPVKSRFPQFETPREKFDLLCAAVLILFLLARPLAFVVRGMRPPKE